MREVFSGEYNEGMNIRNLLENKDIEVFVVNESQSNTTKVLILKVNDDDFEIAIKLIQDYDDGILGLD